MNDFLTLIVTSGFSDLQITKSQITKLTDFSSSFLLSLMNHAHRQLFRSVSTQWRTSPVGEYKWW